MNRKNIRAFTLIELSIVIVIIGLIVAGVVGGQELVNQAKIRKVITDAKNINVAVNTFKLTYDALPGDISNATSYWSGTGNGDGGGGIEAGANTAGSGSSEAGRVFEHLQLAGLLKGSFKAGNVLSTTPTLAYPSAYPQGGYIITEYTIGGGSSPVNRNHIGGNSFNAIRLGKYTSSISQSNTHVGYGLLSVSDVQNIDTKIDDGKARSGIFTGHNEYSNSAQTATACLKFPSGNTSDASGEADYNLGTSNVCNATFDTHLK